MMGLRPPVPNVLVAPDPRFAISAIRNRFAQLQITRVLRRVVPVVPLSPGDVGFQVIQVVDRPPIGIGMILSIPPVRQWHVIVDPDEVDIRIGPKRIEVEIEITAAVLRVIAEILRPVGSIADPDIGS